MKNILLVLTMALLSAASLSAQDKMTADTAKSTLSWLGEKVTGQHTGNIGLKSGWLTMQDNKIVSGEFVIDMTSITESKNTEMLVNDLKSDHFFSVDKFPVSTLALTGSTSFEKGNATVTGNLTIKGITNPIEFKAAIQKTDEGTRFYANIIVDRAKFNVRYGSGTFFENLGDKTIYDEFKLKVNLLVK